MGRSAMKLLLLVSFISSCCSCFISDCPERGKKRMISSYPPPDETDVDIMSAMQKRDLGYLYDMPYYQFRPSISSMAPIRVKKDLRFLYNMLYKDNIPRNLKYREVKNSPLMCVGQICKLPYTGPVDYKMF